MLIIGDLSGIQDYLFDVRQTGGRQAASLRWRSFHIQLIGECIARRFLWGCGLEENKLLLVAAGKFAIDAGPAPAAAAAVAQAHADCERWLLGHAQGRLRLAVGTAEAGTPGIEPYAAAMAALQRSKLSAWSAAAGGQAPALVAQRPPQPDAEAQPDAEQGRQLLKADVAVLSPAPAGNGADGDGRIAGIAVSGTSRDEAAGGGAPAPAGGAALDLRRLTRHVPREPDGSPTDFVTLAARSRGAALLGVLKADADSLAAAIGTALAGASDFTPLCSLSRRLERFFGQELDQIMAAPGSGWADLYTVFSGGDDALLVGPWNVAIDFAELVRDSFAEAFGKENLTISAGVALVKPRFPVRLAVLEAERLLEQAKTQPAPGSAAAKDQCAVLGGCWKWSEHQRVIGAAKQLAGWVDSGQIEHGCLATLLELVLLQRTQAPSAGSGQAHSAGSGQAPSTGSGQAPSTGSGQAHSTGSGQAHSAGSGQAHSAGSAHGHSTRSGQARAAVAAPATGPPARSAALAPAMASSRLAYHVARNWPQTGPARRWVDHLRRRFEQPRAADPLMTHLPSILRYAMLATRVRSEKE